MLKEIKKIGEVVKEKKLIGKREDLEILTDYIDSDDYPKAFILDFTMENDKVKFKGIDIEDTPKKKQLKYLYKTGSSRGTDRGPTSRIAGNIKKTFENKIKKWFKKGKDESSLFKKIFKEIKKNEENIISELEKDYEGSGGGFLTIRINNKFPAEIDTIREKFIDNISVKLKEKYNTKSFREGVCAICDSKKQVFGFGLPFSFFSVDQPAFAYNLERENASKQMPVCYDCYIDFLAAKEFMMDKKYLSFSLFKFRYQVIPESGDEEIISDLLSEVKQFKDSSETKGFTRVLHSEDIFSEIVEKYKDKNLTLNYLFYREATSERSNIKKLIEDVPPSWVRKIGKKINELNKKSFWVTEDYNFYLDKIKTFYYDDSQNFNERKFLEAVANILKQEKINYFRLIKGFDKKVKKEFQQLKANNNNSLKYSSLLSLYVLLLLDDLELLKNKNEINLKKYENMSIYTEFLDENKKIFNTDSICASFLIGVYAGYLINLQYKIKNDSPIEKNLYDLRLNENRIKKLLPKLKNKMKEYSKISEYSINYKQLENDLARYMVNAGDNWNLKIEEISYYFTLGLMLKDFFKDKKNN